MKCQGETLEEVKSVIVSLMNKDQKSLFKDPGAAHVAESVTRKVT